MNQTTENHSSLSIRRAECKDAEAIASLFQSAYGAASHPDLNVQQLRQRLADPRNCWLVGEDAEGIAATMGMIYYPHNDSYELGRAFTQPVYRRSGIALDLIQRCCQWAQQQPQGSVVFGFPRVRRIYEICANNPELPIPPVGHDGAVNVANGQREYHLIISAFLRGQERFHIAPARPSLANAHFIRTQIFQALGLRSVTGSYPHHTFISPHGETTPSKGDAEFACEYDPHDCSGALTIHRYRGNARTPAQLCRELDAVCRAYPLAQTVSATILADKTELIALLLQRGFAITAYLPGWFAHEQHRYDCVRVVKRFCPDVPAGNGLEEQIQRFQNGFRNIFALNSATNRRMACTAS